MEKIFKYELEIKDEQFINMPSMHRILSVQEQNGKLCLWAIVEEGNKMCNQKILICGTGNLLSDGLIGFSYGAPYGFMINFIGTVQMPDGLVWHVFSKY
jgi:hypothetical protein